MRQTARPPAPHRAIMKTTMVTGRRSANWMGFMSPILPRRATRVLRGISEEQEAQSGASAQSEPKARVRPGLRKAVARGYLTIAEAAQPGAEPLRRRIG